MSAHAEAIQRASEIMGEHFAGFLIIGVEEHCERFSDSEGEAIRIETGGGLHTAIGLAVRAQSILTRGEPVDDPNV